MTAVIYQWRSFVLLWLASTFGVLPSIAAQGVFPTPVNTLPAPMVRLLAKTSQEHNVSVRLAVHIPENHHGYLDTGDEGFYIPLSFSFPTLEANGAHIILMSHPRGSRDEIAHATVLRGYGEFSFQIEGQATLFQDDSPFPALFLYQICNDVTNICYPPQELVLSLSSPEPPNTHPAIVTTQRPNSQPLGTSLTLNERLYALFKSHSSNSGWAFMLVFAAGLLASATPCVYPMLPITAAIFTARSQGSWRRGQLHALVYFMGLTCFYALMGLLATTTGTALSAVMTKAWIHLSFALLFAYLGLSMLGLYEFQLFPALMAQLDTLSSKGRGFVGTLCMGATAGLIVSPCVGPIMGTILLEIAGQTVQTNSTTLSSWTTTIPLRGVLLMSGFGLGIGLPFLFIGLLSSKLPHSGTWLTKTKYLLAVPTLYFAYFYYVKGMETAGIPLPIAQAILIGILAIGGAVCSGVFYPLEDNASFFLWMKRTIGITLLIVGIHFLYNGLGQTGFLLDVPRTLQTSPASGSAPDDAAVEIHANLRWLREFSLAQQRARAEQKPLFVDFYATWCANCRAFQQLAVSHPQLNAALQQVVLVKIYDTDPIFRMLQQEPHYPELRGIGGQPLLPLFAIYSAQGVLVWKGQDYQAASTMIAQLEYAKGLKTP